MQYIVSTQWRRRLQMIPTPLGATNHVLQCPRDVSTAFWAGEQPAARNQARPTLLLLRTQIKVSGEVAGCVENCPFMCDWEWRVNLRTL